MSIPIEKLQDTAKQICKKYNLTQKDDIDDIIDYALDLLPEHFSQADWRQTLIDVCEDFIWANTSNS